MGTFLCQRWKRPVGVRLTGRPPDVGRGHRYSRRCNHSATRMTTWRQLQCGECDELLRRKSARQYLAIWISVAIFYYLLLIYIKHWHDYISEWTLWQQQLTSATCYLTSGTSDVDKWRVCNGNSEAFSFHGFNNTRLTIDQQKTLIIISL